MLRTLVTREPVPRRFCALLAALSLGWSGCAVHDWRPTPNADLESLEGRTVRAVGSGGGVQLTVVGFSYPFLTGRYRSGSGRVHVDLGPRSTIAVRRCNAAGPPGRGPYSGALALLAGCDVEIDDGQGLLALRVEATAGPHELLGRTLGGSCGAGRAPCVGGFVRVDMNDYVQVDEQRLDAPGTVLATVGGLLVSGLVVLGALVGVWVVACRAEACY